MELKVFFKDIKFEHSLFALPFAYLGLFLAGRGWPGFSVFLGVTAAMVSFRTFAMALNRVVDREIDARNPRTLERALPQKKLTSQFAVCAVVFSVFLFLASAWFLGTLCFLLSPIPILLAGIYPYLKRFTWLSHGVLGIILGISPYGAWLAVKPEFSWVPGLLMVGVASWVAGFDIFYSLQDLEFDRATGLWSVAVRFGMRPALWICALLHTIAFLSWAGAGKLAGLGGIYGSGLLVAGIFLLREHGLVHRFGLGKIQQAFFTLNAGISVALFLAAVVDLYLL